LVRTGIEADENMLESGYYRFQKDLNDGFYYLEEVGPTDDWEAGYDEGYNHGFEAGKQFAGLPERV